jgi:vacuolar-type H+-ATPase subunit E/Vma4
MTAVRSTTETVRADPLEPVRRALSAAARLDAETTLAQADADAAAVLEEATQRALAIRADARALGEADARERVRVDRAQARKDARRLMLEAQRQVYADLRRAVLTRVAALRREPGYDTAVARLTARAREALGPDSTVTASPTGDVVVESRGQRVTFSLDALVDEVIASFGTELEGLWRP